MKGAETSEGGTTLPMRKPRQKWQDSIGVRYGHLLVVSGAPVRGRHRHVSVVCDCGVTKEVSLDHLRGGLTKSCGCIKVKYNYKATDRTLEYQSWKAMKARCLNQNSSRYTYYGGRGITMCTEWLDFEAFYSCLGKKPSPGHTLDRIDVNLPYQPGNCKWATQLEQVRNQRRTVFVVYKGARRNFAELCDELNVPYKLAYSRFFTYGWDLEDSVTLPVQLNGFKYKDSK